MPNFSEQEVIIINREKKEAKDLPKYYFARNKAETPISRDFEAYLILEGQAHKQQTLSWIKDVISIQKDQVDRDDLLKKFIGLRLADANATYDELKVKLNNFDKFKAGLFSVGDTHDFASVIEVGLLAQSLQRPLEEMKFLLDRSFHEKVMCNIQTDKLNRAGATQDTQKELSSWQTVISTYKGQSGNATSNQQNTGTSQTDGILDASAT